MAAGPEIWFYHLERTPLPETLAALLEKCLQRGLRAAVRTPNEARLAALDAALWTYREDSFLPHGRDGPHAERQPVLLTSAMAPANKPQILFLLDDAEPGPLEGVTRACVMFDGREEASLKAARARWKAMKAKGANIAYWAQDAAGKWEKKA
jgi:DNA polymerase-3 subunit chi